MDSFLSGYHPLEWMHLLVVCCYEGAESLDEVNDHMSIGFCSGIEQQWIVFYLGIIHWSRLHLLVVRCYEGAELSDEVNHHREQNWIPRIRPGKVSLDGRWLA